MPNTRHLLGVLLDEVSVEGTTFREKQSAKQGNVKHTHTHIQTRTHDNLIAKISY